MSSPSIEDLLGLSEREAARKHLVGVNYQRLRYLATAASAAAFGFLLFYLFASDWLRLLAPAAILGLARGVFTTGEGRWFFRYPRTMLVLWLLAFLTAAVFLPRDIEVGLGVVGVLGPLAMVFYRVPTLDLGVLLGGIWAGTLALPFTQALSNGTTLFSPRLLTPTIITVLCFYFSLAGTRRDRESFLQRFRIEQSRHRERQRMRQELASARQIQLSMLPRREPSFADFDIAAASLPAAEVGGDYYEYFPRDGELAIVVGDVAGHGVASGLLLSGIRSCLYLLHDDDLPPQEMFERLNSMVRQTTERRMFITLLYTVFSPGAHRFTVVGAGHPPPLHQRAASGEVQEVETPALPLGTRLECSYRSRSVRFESGDVFLLYTDGLVETQNRKGESYGVDRLALRFAKAAPEKSARAIREDLLSDVWNFKGDSEQLDDITLVVIRTGSGSNALERA